MPRMKDVTVEQVLDRIVSELDDMVGAEDVVVTRKGQTVTASHLKGNYVRRRFIVRVKEEKFDV